MDKTITRISKAIRTKKNFHQPITNIVINKGLDKSANKISCGTTKGNPNIAISAELPPALLAMADNNVNKRERLKPPTTTINKNFEKFMIGLPSKTAKRKKLIKLIAIINTTL